MADSCNSKVRPARCLSPIPKRAVTRSRTSAMKCSPALHLRSRIVCRRLKKKTVIETLTKIEENYELNTTYISKLTEQSIQLSVVEHADKVDKNSLHQSCRGESFSERNESSAVSSEGLTFPTGVSSFLLDCMDSLPVSETTEPVDSEINSCLSPEEFRGAEDCSTRSDLKRTKNTHTVDWLTCKNSTLLDSSKALNIDLISQITNLSAILGPSSKDNHVEKSVREQLKDECSATAQQVSTVIAGKKVCKSMSAREKTQKQSKGACPVLERPMTKAQFKTFEICSVIRAPASQVHYCSAERFPVDENMLALMKKVPIDDIIRFEEQQQNIAVNQIAQEEKKKTRECLDLVPKNAFGH